MEKVSFFRAAFNILMEIFSRGLVYLLIIVGVWVLISSHESGSSRTKLFQVLGILLLGAGLGLLGISLVGLRLGR